MNKEQKIAMPNEPVTAPSADASGSPSASVSVALAEPAWSSSATSGHSTTHPSGCVSEGIFSASHESGATGDPEPSMHNIPALHRADPQSVMDGYVH